MVGIVSTPTPPPHEQQSQPAKVQGPPAHVPPPPPPPLSAPPVGSMKNGGNERNGGSDKKRQGRIGKVNISSEQKQQITTAIESLHMGSVKHRAHLFSLGKSPVVVPALDYAPSPLAQLATSIPAGESNGGHDHERHPKKEGRGEAAGNATNEKGDPRLEKPATTIAPSGIVDSQHHRGSSKAGGQQGEANATVVKEDDDDTKGKKLAKEGDGTTTSTAVAAAAAVEPKKPSKFPPKPKDIPTLQLDGHVGFDQLPYQYVEKCRAQGFRFNVLLVGPTGIGKTTLAETLFDILLPDFEPCNGELKSVELREALIDKVEASVRVPLRIVETAGFGEQLDKEESVKVIVDYVNKQYEAYLKEELKVRRDLIHYDDTRVHVCLYLLSSTGPKLKPLDVTALRELSRCVNVIPVIAKADTSQEEELARFKQKVMSELKAKEIDIYTFPTDDEEVASKNALLNALRPFSTIGSTEFVEQDGRRFRARRYRWGVVEVENEKYCDLIKLRKAMLELNEDALRERTRIVYYERHRQERLREMGMQDGDAGANMPEAYEEQRKAMLEEISREIERDEQAFLRRCEKKTAEMRNRDQALNIRHREMTQQFKEEMAALEAEIEEQRAQIEKSRRQRAAISNGDAYRSSNDTSSSVITFGGKRHKHK